MSFISTQYLKQHTEEFHKKCQKLQEAFDAQVRTLGLDEEENEEEGSSDQNAVREMRENGEGETSPNRMNGASSPGADGGTDSELDGEQGGESQEQSEGSEKVNSKEELTSM